MINLCVLNTFCIIKRLRKYRPTPLFKKERKKRKQKVLTAGD